jgi:hypothetical protein
VFQGGGIKINKSMKANNCMSEQFQIKMPEILPALEVLAVQVLIAKVKRLATLIMKPLFNVGQAC